MKLIIGLGNPGEKYKTTRHNIGFMAVNRIAKNFSFPDFMLQKKFNAEISEGIINGDKIILAKPQTFMNESGKAVRSIADYYKIGPADIVVIHDDLDIGLGKYKIARDRTSAGHKGVQSIIDMLETKDFTRIRIGIESRKPLDSSPARLDSRLDPIESKRAERLAGESLGASKIPTEAFVLENFTKEEQQIIDGIIEKIFPEIEILIKK